MGLNVFTLVHVLICLAGLLTGFVVVGGWLAGKHLPWWSAWFLATTVATSGTGFLFPFKGFTPAYAVGTLSMLVLAVALYALYVRRLFGAWRRTYVITALVALYFNSFVMVAQLFQKIPVLKELAPTQTEPPFGISQGLVLLLFIGVGMAAVRRFPAQAAA